MLRSTSGLDGGTIEMLCALLTDGCTSPLLNPDVPAERLSAVLTQARVTLATAGAPVTDHRGGVAIRTAEPDRLT